jgi:hypothetical protein
VVYIDFEGRCDGESIQRILENVRPRQLVVVHGTEEETQVSCQLPSCVARQRKVPRRLPWALLQHLVRACTASASVSGLTRVITPMLNETVVLTAERNLFQVRLEALVPFSVLVPCLWVLTARGLDRSSSETRWSLRFGLGAWKRGGVVRGRMPSLGFQPGGRGGGAK